MPNIVTDNGLEFINLGANEFDFEGADRGPDVWRKFNSNVTVLDNGLSEIVRLDALMTKLEDLGYTDGFVNGGIA